MRASGSWPVLAAVTFAAIAAGAGYWAGLHRSGSTGSKGNASPAPAAAPVASPATAKSAGDAGRKVLYWYDPMYPQQKFDRPGKSPYMDMPLQPKYADDAGPQGAGVSIDPRITQNLGVRTAAVERGTLSRRIDAAGTIEADQHRVVAVQARAPGWVESLKVRAVNDRVSRGQLLAEIYSPEILAAQEEYLLLSNPGSAAEDAALRSAARDRLAYLGMQASQIEALERAGKTNPRMALFAPADGVVTELGVKEGGQVNPGVNLFTLVDLSTVWVHAQVPEDQLARVTSGARVEARMRALPGQAFEGRVDYIYPEVDPATRTVRVRSVVRNRGMQLRPGMVADVSIAGAAGRDQLLVPSEAVIYTGQRNVVIVADAPGKFRAVEVNIGQDAGGRTEVTAGLTGGQQVVVSGQFLIDSEASLSSALTRLQGAETPPESHAGHAASSDPANPGPTSPGSAKKASSPTHQGEGTVKSIDAAEGKLALDHQAIKSLGWPAMTMGFAVQDRKLLNGLSPGEPVRFRLQENAEGDYVVVAIEPKR